MFRLDGKTALITGGTSGIGLATARLFLERGARVIVTGRDERSLAEVTRGTELVPARADVTLSADRKKLAEFVEARTGGLDVLFVNAGVADFPLFHEIDEERFDATFDVNVKGAFFTVRELLPFLKSGASVILTTSTADTVGLSRLSLYGASKAALAYLGRALSAELAPRGIRVNSLCPGPTETPIHAKYAARLTPEALESMGRETMSRNVAGRLASADEIASAALYLASDASNYVRGHELVIDGGISL